MRTRIRHLPNAIRLTGFLLAASLVTTAVTARHARAQANEGMRRLARQLMPYAEQGVVEAPRRVSINGETLYLAMGTTRDSVAGVLDYYENQCNRRGGHVTEALRAEGLDGAAFNRLWGDAAPPGARIETWREGDEREGFVACVDAGNTSLTREGLSARLQRVVDTGDLSHWGNLRYAYVTRGAGGGTRILTVATEGRFNLLGMFPTAGDAPGQDISGLARYPGMRRVLSAHEDGQPNALGMYTVHAPEATVRTWYRNEMARHGWTPTELPRDQRLPPEVVAQRDHMAAFARANDATLVLVFQQSGDATSMMSLLAM
jgi:hypothetical protein